MFFDRVDIPDIDQEPVVEMMLQVYQVLCIRLGNPSGA